MRQSEILQLRGICPYAIISANKDYYMNSPPEYVIQLETLITERLLPIHAKYYALLGQIEPDVGLSYVFKLRQKVPALFKPKNNKLVKGK